MPISNPYVLQTIRQTVINNPPTIVRQNVVHATQTVTLNELDRAVQLQAEGIVCYLPYYTGFQQGKPYTITNTSTGNVFLVAAEGESIQRGSETLSSLAIIPEESIEVYRDNQKWVIH